MDGAHGFAADAARSSHGPGTSVRDPGTRRGAASDGVDGDYHARNDLAAAWYSWMASPSGTSNPRHLTKRLRTARGAFRAAVSAAYAGQPAERAIDLALPLRGPK